MTRGLSVLALAALVSGCAGGMTTADCEAADWAALGFADGRSGARPKLAEGRLGDCTSKGYAVDRAAYAAARTEGLSAYCTGAGGFDAGRLGAEYFDVCPASAEPGFLAGYTEGAQLYVLIAAEQAAGREQRAAVEALDQHRFLLRAVDKRASSSTINNEDRENARQEAAFRRREIVRLEQDLPKLGEAIAKARATRTAHEEALRASGRLF